MLCFKYDLRQIMCKFRSHQHHCWVFSPKNSEPKTCSLKNAVWNRWCFWRHKLPCNQSRQHV